MIKPLSAAIAAALLFSTDIALAEGTDSPTLKLRLMETTDIHMNLLNYNYFTGKVSEKIGLSKAATLIKQARAEATNSLLVDNGDLLQGSPMGDYMARQGIENGRVHPAFKAMNTLDYVVGNIGNHEFNFGLDFLHKSVAGANFPYISANVFIDDGDDNPANDKPAYRPYLITDQLLKDESGKEHRLKVGFIGFVPPQIMNWDKENLEGKVITKDMVEMAKLWVPIMKKQGADIVVAIPHSGLDISDAKAMQENATYHLSKVAGIDAIMFGHAHNIFPGGKAYNGFEAQGIDNVKGSINGIPAVMPGFWANHIGLIDLELAQEDGKWAVKGFSSELRSVAETTSDKALEATVAEEHAATDKWVSEPFAKIAAPVNSFFALAQDDPSIQIVSDAQIWYGKKLIAGTEYDGLPVLSAAAPFRAGRQGSADFTNVAAGDIAYRNVADLYIYPNTLQILKLTGAQVREWLEMSAGQFNQIDATSTDVQPLINTEFPSYNFDVIDGVTYKIDVTQPAKYIKDGSVANETASRIVELQYEGKAIDDAQEFLVVSNNYRASGGGNFPNVGAETTAIKAPNENRQVVADYITEQAAANADGFDPSADNNWRFKAINDSVVVTLRSSPLPEASAFADTLPQLVATDELDADGFAVYKLDLSK
ncbi:bifunctional 2',3'-cyclic-nucleotide 2'-phosphodiesterase/3'-nucleotidase [Leucothrix arctica]|uniref:Bifunctional 2',3'-cyclic-nucleotide 2'-phosphodiesterase/3'-nucleotidase n=1 Tax=Leucothrix arctica TaxID=1481894 RepID=A0A317CC36_9GAMM|nr:bifunctional 2',3'-cyclic-nucleotide 2'-phosphodiesterase/3'-nucleotidase [Leucothrix arctica]PWQ96245.1 bifunctional 2',3'-cyclic-nucleotide 2'-phosphodiesterase/3'-nucleotidase [Leucothrix arctica]